MLKRIVNGIEIATAVLTVVFIILLFVDEAPGTKVASTATTSPYDSVAAPAAPDGAALYSRQCSACHGSRGQGGTGPRLAGTVVNRFADPQAQALYVANGSGSMPPFESTLTDAEIDAVVEYTRGLK